MIMASNKHIILLFILPLIFATVQSTARCGCGLENCESTPLGAMVWQFYCTSHSLRILSWNMVNVSTQYVQLASRIKHIFLQEHNAVALPAKLDVDNQENISQISQQNNQENISQISQQNNQENSSQISQQNNISQILQQFDFTCKTFTTAMAIKHQLQCSIFNGTYYFNDSNGILVNMTSEEGIRNLNSTLEYIETLASILQNIEVHLWCILTNRI